MKDQPFINRDGQLSRYALACGHVQKFTRGASTIELHQEFMQYHVSRYGPDPIRDSFDHDQLTAARERYISLVQELKRSQA